MKDFIQKEYLSILHEPIPIKKTEIILEQMKNIYIYIIQLKKGENTKKQVTYNKEIEYNKNITLKNVIYL